MHTETVVIAIVVGLMLLIGGAFTIQSIERNRQERVRLEAILKKRAGTLHYLLDNFPDNFLGSDLKVLVCKSLLEVYEELSQASPKSHDYASLRQDIGNRITQLQTQNKPVQYRPMENQAQINDIKRSLQLLGGFVSRLQQTGGISKEQGKGYNDQLRRLLIQTSIDSLSIAARQAESEGKLRLAIHYYQSALDKLAKENMEGVYHEHFMAYRDRIDSLRQQALEAGLIKNIEDDVPDEVGEWEKFLDNKEVWKKKNIYD